jgi:hypothetical protein
MSSNPSAAKKKKKKKRFTGQDPERQRSKGAERSQKGHRQKCKYKTFKRRM